MNKVIIMGRLARDPEVRSTQSGKHVATFTIAVDRIPKTAGADFLPIVAWEKLADLASNYLTKGRQVLIEGRMQVRQYEDKQGQKRTITEVIAQNIEFCGSRNDNQQGGIQEQREQTVQQGNQMYQQRPQQAQQGSFGENFASVDVPF